MTQLKNIIVNNLYNSFGSHSGILFGIEERQIVEKIVEFTLQYTQQDKPISKEEEQKEIIEDIGKKYFPCTCGEIYLSRKLNAPDCEYHSSCWQEAMEELTNKIFNPSANKKEQQSKL